MWKNITLHIIDAYISVSDELQNTTMANESAACEGTNCR